MVHVYLGCRVKYWLILCLFFPALVLAKDEVDKAAEAYAKKLAAIEKEHDRSRMALAVKYMGGLERLEASGRKEGSLDKVVSAQKEIERFNKTQTLTEADLNHGAVALKKGQLYFLAEYGKLDRKTAAAKATLAKDYSDFLSSLEVRLVKENKIVHATKVRGMLQDLADAAPAEIVAPSIALAPAKAPGTIPRQPGTQWPLGIAQPLGLVPDRTKRPGVALPSLNGKHPSFTIKLQNGGTVDTLEDKDLENLAGNQTHRRSAKLAVSTHR